MFNRRLLLSAGTALALLAATAYPSWAGTVRIAIPNPPFARGNPFQAPGPANAYVAPAIFDGLTRIDGDGQVHPALALSWSTDESGRVWTFRLRPGVTFSNGTPFTAAAMVAALTYLTDKPLPSDLVALEFADVASFRAVDPLTFEITARRPMPLMPQVVSVLYAVEPNHWQRLGPQGFGGAPIGTGPFKVERWTDAGVNLTAAKTSWRAPKADSLEILFQQEPTARLQGLLAGRIDIALTLAEEDRGLVEAAGARLQSTPVPSVTALMFLAAKANSPFADVRVRQALNYAVDKTRLVKTFFGGAVPIASQPAARAVLGYDPALQPYPYDPARAQALLTEAGRGKGFAFTLEAVVGSSGADGAIYQQIAQDLAAVNVQMTVRSIPGVRFGQLFRTAGWQGDAFSFIFDASPAFDGVRALKYYTCGWTPRNYCDAAAEPMFADAEQATTIAGRGAIARRLMARYREQASALFLYEAPRFHGVSDRVRGFRMDHTRIAFEDIAPAP